MSETIGSGMMIEEHDGVLLERAQTNGGAGARNMDDEDMGVSEDDESKELDDGSGKGIHPPPLSAPNAPWKPPSAPTPRLNSEETNSYMGMKGSIIRRKKKRKENA